jgi:hypothetical protein
MRTAFHAWFILDLGKLVPLAFAEPPEQFLQIRLLTREKVPRKGLRGWLETLVSTKIALIFSVDETESDSRGKDSLARNKNINAL